MILKTFKKFIKNTKTKFEAIINILLFKNLQTKNINGH